ncbi:MAG: hypothetical protein WD063_21420 [Pirellulales bacterium]
MDASRRLILSLALLAIGWPVATAGGQELKRIDRTIGKLPQLHEPLYALAILGAKKETRMWLVVDKSSPQSTQHDVLFIDLDGDGDLTAENERVSHQDAEGHFKIPVLVDPKSGVEHTDFSLRLSPGSHMLSVRWRGGHKIGGGYPVDPKDGYMQFGKSPQEAPIVWLNGDGPFRFQPWYNDTLAIGGETDVKLFLGQEGVGANAFCAFQEHVLPEDEFVVAILIYTDKDGKQREATSNLDLRC